MTPEKFEEVLNDRLSKIKTVLSSKAKEYSSNSNRLHNFDVAARMDSTTPEKALKGMLLKHEVSVRDLIEWAGSIDSHKITVALIDEKIGDVINYYILLEAMLLRRIPLVAPIPSMPPAPLPLDPVQPDSILCGTCGDVIPVTVAYVTVNDLPICMKCERRSGL